MGAIRQELSPELITFIGRQPVFFTASAAVEGRINCSPKGMDTFRVFSPTRVGYLDLTGSGNETAAHVAHDGRLTIMMCSFAAKPLILRMYGRGSVITQIDPRWPALIARFAPQPGQRQIILLDIESVQTSCGFGVPRMDVVEERQTLFEWAEKKGDAGIRQYWSKHNQKSIDALPAPPLE